MSKDHPLSLRIWNYLLDKQDDIDIHQPVVSWCDRSTLKKMRILSWFVLTVIYLAQLYLSVTFMYEIKFLTKNGLFASWLYFGLTILDGNLNNDKRKSCPELKYWITCIYEFSFALQVPITVIYWVVLYPNDVRMFPAWQTAIFASTHIFPIFLQGLDFIFNGFRFKNQRIWILLCYSFCYMVINISFTLYSGMPVYVIITWKDKATFIYLAIMYVLAIGGFFLFGILACVFKADRQKGGQVKIGLKKCD